jgi:thiol-disulfide isomerase/thioredoxin
MHMSQHPIYAKALLRAFIVGAMLCGPLGAVQAQGLPQDLAVGADLQFKGSDVRGKPFNMAATQGKVAVVFIWSTACAVCRDSLPELRLNAKGWQAKPFVLVSANIDRKTEDWLSYEAAVGATQPVGANWLSVHQRAEVALAAKLPITLLVNAKGKVVSRYEGRLAPEVWDGVADLLP